MLFFYHCHATGRCFPSYETIADKAKVARSTVGLAIKALEECQIITWANRKARVQVRNARGKVVGTRTVRGSQGYHFFDPRKGLKRSINTSESAADHD